MSIDASRALRNPGAPYPFEDVVDIGRIAFETGDFHVVEPVTVKGTMTAMDDEIFAKGAFSARLLRVCDRCSEPFTHGYDFSFDEVFVRDAQRGSADHYAFAGEEIDLIDLIEDCIVLQIPTASLCREDCRGLCPLCGANLNLARCNCDTTKQQRPSDLLSGWAEPEKEE